MLIKCKNNRKHFVERHKFRKLLYIKYDMSFGAQICRILVSILQLILSGTILWLTSFYRVKLIVYAGLHPVYKVSEVSNDESLGNMTGNIA